jgi:hypothetical protein
MVLAGISIDCFAALALTSLAFAQRNLVSAERVRAPWPGSAQERDGRDGAIIFADFG